MTNIFESFKFTLIVCFVIVGITGFFEMAESQKGEKVYGPTAIGSPHGSVPFGEKAYSPDGKVYACEVEPRDHGKIGIFNLTTGKRLKTINVTQHPAGDYPNDLKGLAWSPDSKLLAVMYHHNGGGHISIMNVDTGEEVKYLTISKWYHHIKFSSDGTKINAEGDILKIR